MFAPFSSFVSAEFWNVLCANKIDNERLNSTNVAARGFYRNVSQYNVLCRFDLTEQSINHTGIPGGSCPASGYVCNTNTLEEFNRFDKNRFLRDAANKLGEHIQSGRVLENPSLLASFALLCFADLKKYHFTYWMAYPTIPTTWVLEKREYLQQKEHDEMSSVIQLWRRSVDPNQWGYFLLTATAGQWQAHTLRDWPDVINDQQPLYFVFTDPSPSDEGFGWPLRNLLLFLRLSPNVSNAKIIAYRERGTSNSNRSIILDYTYSEQSSPSNLAILSSRAVGWEKNEFGKLAPKAADLGRVMDPIRLADAAVDLNLKLMKWRVATELDLKRVKDSKCLLLGAGTLGCYVSRLLMAWGVRAISFVDSGQVSFSNPVRQPLFTFEDCLNGGKPKAKAAAEALGQIYPGVKSMGYSISVPMIGHPITNEELSKKDFSLLQELIESHDAIFLLMDSRESRWLPTVIGTAEGKIVINVALGFDSFLASRHGIPLANHGDTLGCYFCNDVVAPSNSLADRSLDQMCTVTRPGLAAIASGLAVELLVSILQHPLGAAAPAPEKGDTEATTVLGTVPHSIRGYLNSFSNVILKGMAYDCCSACSPTILNSYKEGKWEFVKRALNEAGYIEHLSGLKAVQDKVDNLNLDWAEDDKDDEEFEDM